MRDVRLVITGDDLGLSSENNAGIVAAHERGVLTTTCLMVGGDAAAEGVEIARRYPQLAVGLHVTFADTRPILPPDEVSLLVGTNGRFPPDDVLHKRALRTAKGRRQIRREIAAQLQAYYDTGLAFDHVNTHRHIHRNPILATLLLQEVRAWPVKTIRIPWDPPADPLRRLRASALRTMARFYGLASPDRSIGRDWSPVGLIYLLNTLPDGCVAELYFHPVTSTTHRFALDLPTLLDDVVAAAVGNLKACPGLKEACR